jgi:superfamily II DNA or RNA helicase
MLVHQSQKRLDVMENLLRGFEKNTIVFAHHTEYLNHLYNYFKEKFPTRNVYIITGSTNQKKRDTIIKNLLVDKDAILFASYGCVGTGLTLKNIDYGIFAQSFKSQIINKQALGRGLCLANDKDKYRLYDLIDCFPTKKLYMQGVAKAKLFKKENFEFYIKEIK